MIVFIDENFLVTLRDPKDFKGFKLVARHEKSALRDVAAALQGIALNTDEAHSWIMENWLRAQPGVAEDLDWQRSFDGVVAYAAKKGWVDEGAGAIRAHIEWETAATA